MLTVEQALDAVLKETQPLAPVSVELAEALGLVTAEEAVADIDSPPFDKALMDGFAVRSADLASGEARLQILEVITAGNDPVEARDGRLCDADHDRRAAPRGGRRGRQNRRRRGSRPTAGFVDDPHASRRSGTAHLEAGRFAQTRATGCWPPGGCCGRRSWVLWPKSAGIGCWSGRVRRSPSWPRETSWSPSTPSPARAKSAIPMKRCSRPRRVRAGGLAVPLGIARDDRAELRRTHPGWDSTRDVLLLSGGVSEGTHDLVPSELASLGVRNVFHKINIRPGKPLWFGVWNRTGEHPRSRAGVTYVFGLPGNPVSSLVCFELFVRSCLRRLRGLEPAEPQADFRPD